MLQPQEGAYDLTRPYVETGQMSGHKPKVTVIALSFAHIDLAGLSTDRLYHATHGTFRQQV